ncbi:MAG: ATP-dependent helicase, partial [Pseudoclavibacter sp.]
GVQARTFHAAALSQLGYFWPHTVGGQAPKVLAGKGPVVAEAAVRIGLRVEHAQVRDLATEVEWRKVQDLSVEEYAVAAASRELPAGLGPDQVVSLLQAYEAVKDERRAMDFEDVLLATAGMLELEPWVTQRVREQYRFFVVDEYQDVSPLQHRLLRLWLGGRRELCVVGDPAQTIFSFTGATSDHLIDFEREFPGARTVELDVNYRSTGAVIDVANGLARDIASALQLAPVDNEAAGPAPTLTAFADEYSEAEGVARAISADLVDGVEADEIAVLFRLRGQAEPIERALQAAGIPYVLHGQRRYFDQPIVRTAVTALRAEAAHPRQEPLFHTVRRVLGDLGWAPSAPTRPGAERDVWGALDAIVRLADAAGDEATIVRFASDLAERARLQLEPTLGAVMLSTIHAAKGLEWDSVHVVGASDDLLPFMSARSQAAIDEERRLAYVAVTRARRMLRLSYSRGSGRERQRQPSRFLAPLGTRIRDGSATPNSPSRR